MARKLAFRTSWLTQHGYSPKELVIVKTKGDSMEPTISDGSDLVVNRAQKTPIDGKIFVVRKGNTIWVKRIQVLLDDEFVLISDNKQYSPITINKADMDQLEIIGAVVHISKDI